MIRILRAGFFVYDHTGKKRLAGPFRTIVAAKARLLEIERAKFAKQEDGEKARKA